MPLHKLQILQNDPYKHPSYMNKLLPGPGFLEIREIREQSEGLSLVRKVPSVSHGKNSNLQFNIMTYSL